MDLSTLTEPARGASMRTLLARYDHAKCTVPPDLSGRCVGPTSGGFAMPERKEQAGWLSTKDIPQDIRKTSQQAGWRTTPLTC